MDASANICRALYVVRLFSKCCAERRLYLHRIIVVVEGGMTDGSVAVVAGRG